MGYPVYPQCHRQGHCPVFPTYVLPFSGMPEQIVTDRGPQFISTFFRELLRCVGVHHKLPTPYHPQSNGALERWHRDLGTHLRLAVMSLSKEVSWADGLGVAVLAHNTTFHMALNMSPYELCFGFKPKHTVEEWKQLNLPVDEVRSLECQDRLTAIHKCRTLALDSLRSAQRKYNNTLEATRGYARYWYIVYTRSR